MNYKVKYWLRKNGWYIVMLLWFLAAAFLVTLLLTT
jgi:hypothetical protein